MKNIESLGQRSVFVVVLQSGSLGLLFLLQILLAKMMGEQEYGIYIYALNWIYLLVLFSKMGLDTALLRFVPQYLVKGKQAEAYGIITRAFQMTGMISVLAGTVLAAVVLTFVGTKGDNLTITFLYGAALLPLISLLKISQSVIQSLKRVVFAQTLEGIFIPLALMVVVMAGYKAGVFIAAPFVMASMVGIVTLALLFSWAFISRISLLFNTRIKKNFEVRLWVRTAVPFMLISGMLMLLSYLDTIMVGVLVNPTQAGIYSVASRIAMFTAFVLGTLNNAVAPFISGYIADDNYEAVQNILARITLVSFIFACLFGLVLYSLGMDILAVFSSSFVAGYFPLLVLLVGHLINTGSGSVGLLMNLSGKQDVAVLFIAGALIINVALNFLLIPRHGMVGASIATAISIAAWNVGLAVYIKRHLGVDTTILSVWRLLQ